MVVGLVLLLGFGFRNFSANVIHGASYPIFKVTDFISKPFSDAGAYFSSKKFLVKQNAQLIDENKMLKLELVSVKGIEKQNQELKEILNVRDSLTTPRITAEVIQTPPFSPFDTFTVKIPNNFNVLEGDVNQTIKIGNNVFIKNILVGQVKEVYKDTAIVKLFSTYGEKFAIKINQEIIAEAIGLGSLSFKIEIPKDLKIEKGYPIYSLAYPETIIGFVENTETAESSSFQVVYFQYPFNFSSFNFVEIEY